MGRDNMDGFDEVKDEGATGDLSDIEDLDPFSPKNIGTIQFIMLARIYDLLMLDLAERNPEAANQVSAAHHKGSFLGVVPVMNGQFLRSEEIEKTQTS